MSDFFSDIVSSLGDEHTNFLSEGTNSSEFSSYIDTGSYILNALFSGSIFGGVPDNKIVTFGGEPATGKTFFVLGVVKQFLDDNADGAVIYFDTESAVTRKMMEERGVDSKRLIVSEPQTIQEFRAKALQILERYTKSKDRPPMMMVLDSLGQLSTTKEMEDSTEGKETRDMTKAQVIKATFRTLNLKLAKAKVPLFVTNHVYDSVGAYVPTKVMSGGSGLQYSSSQIAMLSKRKDKDGQVVKGNYIKVKMAKSRLTKENSFIDVKLSYDQGLDRYYGLLDLAEEAGMIKKSGAWLKLRNGDSTQAGRIYADPEKFFTQEFLEELDEYAAKKFLYGRYTVEEEEVFEESD